MSIPESRVSIATPDHMVSSLVHLVTQWMSTLTSSCGSCASSSQLHDFGASTVPRIVKVHLSSGVCGVGPADRTGKSFVTYWPGGTRDGSTGGRRLRKPREMMAIMEV